MLQISFAPFSPENFHSNNATQRMPINIRAWKANGLWCHKFATYGYKLIIHFYICLFCDVTDRQLIRVRILNMNIPWSSHRKVALRLAYVAAHASSPGFWLFPWVLLLCSRSLPVLLWTYWYRLLWVEWNWWGGEGGCGSKVEGEED